MLFSELVFITVATCLQKINGNRPIWWLSFAQNHSAVQELQPGYPFASAYVHWQQIG